MASIRTSEREPKRVATRATGQGVVVGSEAVKAPLALLGALVARGLSESAASAESRTLSRQLLPAPRRLQDNTTALGSPTKSWESRGAHKLQKFGQAH